jgi:hypothetical protein
VKKWQDLAAPDDQGSWYAISNMWATKRGTYESADSSTATEIATAGTGAALYAFVGRTLSASREYVVANSKIWEYSAGALTDRTGGVATASAPMMVNYGDVTICVMGAATATVKSTGGNFSALAGAPNAEIVVVCRNAVVAFNTNTAVDGWAASDVGDYTNWATGESASGRIIDTPGEVLAATVLGNDIIVFKRSAIYRMTYVGGIIKWQVQLAWSGLGVTPVFNSGYAKYQVVTTASGVAFNGAAGGSGSGTPDTAQSLNVRLFDGSSPPRLLNPLTTLPSGFNTTSGFGTLYWVPVFFYDPVEDVLCIAHTMPLYYYYSFPLDAWGTANHGYNTSAGEDLDSVGVAFVVGNGVLQGDYYAQPGTSSRPAFYRYGTTNSKLRRCVPSAPGSSNVCYLQSMKYGDVTGVTTFNRLIPKLRRRSDLGTDSAALTFDLFNELEDTTPATTRSVTESTARKRFDLMNGACSAPFGRFKVTWTALDVEVDDFVVNAKYVAGGS